METVTSKLTSKYQATIPEPVRRALHLSAGDTITFDIDNNQICLRKARPVDLVFAKAVAETLTEWQSAEDEEAYRDL